MLRGGEARLQPHVDLPPPVWGEPLLERQAEHGEGSEGAESRDEGHAELAQIAEQVRSCSFIGRNRKGCMEKACEVGSR